MTQHAFTNGFWVGEQGTGAPAVYGGPFPRPRTEAYDQNTVYDSLLTRRPSLDVLLSDDRFAGRNDYYLIAEPAFVHGWPWRVLFTAIRIDDTRLMAQPWIDRVLGKGSTPAQT